MPEYEQRQHRNNDRNDNGDDKSDRTVFHAIDEVHAKE
jgi:hypothetical protein